MYARLVLAGDVQRYGKGESDAEQQDERHIIDDEREGHVGHESVLEPSRCYNAKSRMDAVVQAVAMRTSVERAPRLFILCDLGLSVVSGWDPDEVVEEKVQAPERVGVLAGGRNEE